MMKDKLGVYRYVIISTAGCSLALASSVFSRKTYINVFGLAITSTILVVYIVLYVKDSKKKD